MEVFEIDKITCIDFIQTHHYSKVMPRLTKHYLGLFHEKNLCGCMTLGWGTQPLQTIRKLFPDLTSKDYYEIGKMCCHDDMPRNTESQFISLVKKWLKKNTKKLFLYTWADGIVGKVGYVYQASNFYYGGYIWTDVYIGKDGEKIHPRSSKPLLIENAKFKNVKKLFWLTPDFTKLNGIERIRGKMFRYILPLSKKSLKMIKYNPMWSINYPKNIDLSWKRQVCKGKYEICDIPTFALDVVNINKKNVNEHKKEKIFNIF